MVNQCLCITMVNAGAVVKCAQTGKYIINLKVKDLSCEDGSPPILIDFVKTSTQVSCFV